MRIRKTATQRKASTKRDRKVTARSAPKRATRVSAGAKAAAESGLAGFAVHVSQPTGQAQLAKVARPPVARRGIAAAAPVNLKLLDAETAAQYHLDGALASDALAKFVRPAADGAESEFKSLGTESVPLTHSQVVKFRQYFNKVPVYGSLVTVELDKSNACLGINSSLGTPKGVDHIATISPAQALKNAAKAGGLPASRLSQTPRLHYYFDPRSRKWRLAYIIEDVDARRRGKSARGDVSLKDFVVDAHTGRLLAELPRIAASARVEVVRDANNKRRRITIETGAGGKRQLRDITLNVTTCCFDFKDPTRQSQLLPGRMYEKPPAPWPPEAIGAHANGSEVARFLRKVVMRNNIDNRGGEMISTVNCWDRDEGTRPAKQWKNAYWNGDQMVYGQVLFPDGSFYSVASMLDVVGHEMFHGVTDHSSRLEYVTQPGALNESYSDIFGAIIANFGKPLRNWNWEIGTGFDGPGTVLRDMRDPTLHEQPKHMRDFRTATYPYTWARNDYGWVHDNSGIHNYAAFRIMTAMSGDKYLFTARQLAAMFYIALTAHLSRTSQFADSRRAVVQAARSLFRKQSAASLARKVAAVESGFTAAGIA